MRLLIPVLLLLLGLGGGVAAGLFLGQSSVEDAVAPSESDATQASDTEDISDSATDGSFAVPADGSTEYVRLRNQFIVPVVRDGTVRSLVILALTIEVTAGGSDAVFEHEPRLRDSFLRVMFAHANAGGFDSAFTEAAAMDPLRRGLRDAAVAVLGEGARDVLIVDITRQDA